MRLRDYAMTRVVARRYLEYRPAQGRSGKVIVEIGKPAPDPASKYGDWYCPHRITGLGETRVFPVFGVDPVQALILCLAHLSAEITRWGRKDGALRWLGGRQLGLEVHHILRLQAARNRRQLKRRGC
jgi:Domain of unknown function (DUF6968)